jgi:hypothetical protein
VHVQGLLAGGPVHVQRVPDYDVAYFILLNQSRQDFEIPCPAGSLQRSDSTRNESGLVTHGYADAGFAYI